jgi:hypothetical protein
MGEAPGTGESHFGQWRELVGGWLVVADGAGLAIGTGHKKRPGTWPGPSRIGLCVGG